MTDDIRRLLGGYATGTLTEQERELLYQAALEDPAVFEAMAAEQPLRDLLDDSSARAELLAAVQDRPFSVTSALRDWFEKPKSKVLVAAGLVLVVAIGVKQTTESRTVEAPTQIAARLEKVQPPALAEPPAVAPAPAAVPKALKRKTAPAMQPQPEPPAVAAMPQPAPPPAPTPKAELAAKAIEQPTLTFAVRHDPAGAKATVRIESKQDGTLVAKQGTEVLYTGPIAPGSPVAFQRDISDTAVEVEFAPLANKDTLVDGGVVGGVPRTSSVSAFREGRPVLDAPSRPQPVRLLIDLRQQKNP